MADAPRPWNKSRKRDLQDMVMSSVIGGFRRKWLELEDKNNPASNLTNYDDIISEIFDTKVPSDAGWFTRVTYGLTNSVSKNWLRGNFARQYTLYLDGDYDQRCMRELVRKLKERFPFPLRTDGTFGITKKTFSLLAWIVTFGSINPRGSEIRWASIDDEKLVFIVGNGTILPTTIKLSQELPAEFTSVIKLLDNFKSKLEKSEHKSLKLLGVRKTKEDTSTSINNLIKRNRDPEMKRALEEVSKLLNQKKL